MCCKHYKKVADDQLFYRIPDWNKFLESLFPAGPVSEGFHYGKLSHATTNISHFFLFRKLVELAGLPGLIHFNYLSDDMHSHLILFTDDKFLFSILSDSNK